MKKARFFHLTYFIWTLVALSLFLSVKMMVTPAFIWSYQWNAPATASYSDTTQRYYTRCTYIGTHGTFTENAVDGKCGWLRFPSRRVGTGQ